MGASERIKGLANEVAGKAKRGVAEVIGDAELQAEGLAQEAEGRLQQAGADARELPASGSGTADPGKPAGTNPRDD